MKAVVFKPTAQSGSESKKSNIFEKYKLSLFCDVFDHKRRIGSQRLLVRLQICVPPTQSVQSQALRAARLAIDASSLLISIYKFLTI